MKGNEMNDPLAQFRKKPFGSAADTPPPTGSDEYMAFDAKDKVARLKIRRANDPTRSPGYNYLLDIVYDGPFGTNFVLVFTFMMVFVRGRNLQNLVMALETGTADFIQEFDSDRWQVPKDAKAPFIESIVVSLQESGPSFSESEKGKKTVH